jgi:hypothetical protein
MKRNLTALCITLLALGAGAPALAAPHSHDEHAAPSQLSFDHGRKWATDEPLRRHMGEIGSALAAKSPRILARQLTDEEARLLGAAIELRVAGIVTDCKLPPAADANLHLVVADLVQAADVLQGRTKQPPQKGTAIAARATQMYATYFEHPGWKPVY